MTVRQDLGLILENNNKKIELKNVSYKKWSPKFIFINEKKSQIFFCFLTLRFWHCTAIPSSEHWDFEREIKGYTIKIHSL